MIKKYLPFVFEIFKIFVIASVIVLPIRYFLFQPFIVKGESMVPSFQPGDYLIVDEISYRFSEPQRGDVVVFKYPKDKSQKFIKRIIGLPGETIEIKDDKITVRSGDNEKLLEEDYLSDSPIIYGTLNFNLGEDEYFVLGDNRGFSYDSRVWGSVSSENIIGKALLRLFPITSISKIEAPSY